MLRTQISLTVEERRLLDDESKKTGRSIASLIRIAVNQTYGTDRSADYAIALLRQCFGVWDPSPESGEEYVNRLRSGSRLDALRS